MWPCSYLSAIPNTATTTFMPILPPSFYICILIICVYAVLILMSHDLLYSLTRLLGGGWRIIYVSVFTHIHANSPFMNTYRLSVSDHCVYKQTYSIDGSSLYRRTSPPVLVVWASMTPPRHAFGSSLFNEQMRRCSGGCAILPVIDRCGRLWTMADVICRAPLYTCRQAYHTTIPTPPHVASNANMTCGNADLSSSMLPGMSRMSGGVAYRLPLPSFCTIL